MAIRYFQKNFPNLGQSVYVDESAQVIGQVELGNNCSVWPNTTIRGDVNWIKIGQETNIQDGSVLHVTHDHTSQPGGYPLSIGSHVTVGHNVILHGCTVEDNCLIGMGAIVLDGAYIEKNVFLAAGALVSPNKRLESGFLYVGSPAKKVRALTEDEIKGFRYSANHYVKLKNEYLESDTET